MNSLSDLQTLKKLLREFNLPVSPILEYAIQEKEDILKADQTQESLADLDNVDSRCLEDIDHDQPIVDVSCEMNQCSIEPSGGLLFVKGVDYSLLKYGTTIPLDACPILSRVFGPKLYKGCHIDVSIIIEGISYNGYVVQNNLADRDVYQIYLSGRENIGFDRLRSIFSKTWNYIMNSDEKKPRIPKGQYEFAAFYLLNSDEIRIDCYRSGDVVPLGVYSEIPKRYL